MRGREFLDLAREVIAGGTEKHRRGAIGRAYYALMLEGREALLRWGFPLPPRENVHTFVRLHFIYPADADLQLIGRTLEDAGRLRNKADYDLSAQAVFASDVRVRKEIDLVARRLALLDAIDADPARRAAAVAAVRAAFP